MRYHCCVVLSSLSLAISGCCGTHCTPTNPPAPVNGTPPTVSHSQQPASPAVGDTVSLRFEADQDVTWEVPELVSGWNIETKTERFLVVNGPAPLGVSMDGRVHLDGRATNQAGTSTQYRGKLEGRSKQVSANVREVGRSALPGGRSLVFYEITMQERPVAFPDQAGGWQMKFDTQGLGPSDSIKVADNDSGWSNGVTQTLPSNALVTTIDDQGADPQERFVFSSPQATEAIRDGAFTVTVNLLTERIDGYSVSDSMWITLR